MTEFSIFIRQNFPLVIIRTRLELNSYQWNIYELIYAHTDFHIYQYKNLYLYATIFRIQSPTYWVANSEAAMVVLQPNAGCGARRE